MKTKIYQLSILWILLVVISVKAQQKIIDSLENELINPTNGLTKLEILNELSWYYATSDTKKALERAETAIKLAINKGDLLQLGIAYERKGYIYENIGNDSIVVALYVLAENTYTRIGNKRRLGTLAFNKGNFYFYRSDYQKSLKETQKALNTYKSVKDTLKMGSIYNQIGLNQLYLGNYTASLNAFQKGALLLEQINRNESYSYAEIQGNIGLLHEKLSEYQTAMEFQNKALIIHKNNNYETGISNIYNNLGKLYGLLDQDLKALEMFNLAYEIKKKGGNRLRIANALTNLGITYYNLKQYDKADENLNVAKSIYEELGHETNLSIIYKNLGDIYLDKKQAQKAALYFNYAFVYAQKASDKRAMYLAKEGLSKAAFEALNYKKAYQEQLEATAIKESILSNEKRDEFAQLKAKYEYEKEKVILEANFEKNMIIGNARTRHQIFIRNTSIGLASFCILILTVGFTLVRRKKEAVFNSRIATSELQKLKAQMNPHFIFNSLNSINDYVLKNQKDAASSYIVDFSSMMRKILNNSKEESVLLSDEIDFLNTYIKLEQKRLNNTFTFKITASNEIEKEETLVPPALIQPFIENSIWHGLSGKENGLLTVKFTKELDALVCTIDDNGTGMKLNEVSTNDEKSFGTSSVKNRLDLLNELKGTESRFDFVEKDEGLRVVIHLPLWLKF